MNPQNIEAFASRIAGEIVLPDSPTYDGLRTLFNRKGSPALIVKVNNNADIAESIRFARDNGLTLSVRSGGHGLPGLATNDGGLVIDLARLNAVEVLDAARGLVRIGAGARWGAAAKVLGEHGLAISSGDTTTVGVGGLTLGGGIGWLVRKYGLTIDSVEAAEIVTADGKTLRVSADEHADLYWAIRGGGGNFGVVTSFDFRAQPIKTVVGGLILYPTDESASAAKQWAKVMRNAPEELSSTIVFFSGFGPQVPPGLMVYVCYAGDDDAAADKAIQPLLELGTVVQKDVKRKPYHEMLEEGPPPGGFKMVSEAGFIGAITDEVMETMAANYGKPGKPINQIRSLGGAVARVGTDETAFAHRNAEGVFWMVSPMPADTPDEQLERVRQAGIAPLKPFMEGAYVNFLVDASETSVAAVYPPATYERLASVKATYDPDNVFNQNHNVKPGVGEKA